MTPRRLVAVITLGVLALGGLAACRADPAAAAYVGDEKITNERVEAVATELRASLEADVEAEIAEFADREDEVDPEQLEEFRQQRMEELQEQLGASRDRVAVLLVLTDAGTRYAEVQGFEIPEPTPAGVADQVGLDVEHPYVTALADFFAVMTALRTQVEPVEPTEADQREVFENLRFEGQPVADQFEEVQQFLNVNAMGPQVGLRNLLLEMLDEMDVVVNPRYDLVYDVPVQIGQATSSLAVPLGEERSAVVDADRGDG